MEILSLLVSLAFRISRAMNALNGPPNPAAMTSLRGEASSVAIEDQMIEELRRRAALEFAVDHLAPRPGLVGWGMALILNCQWFFYWFQGVHDWWWVALFVLLSALSVVWIAAMAGAASVMRARRKWLLDRAESTAPMPMEFRADFENFIKDQPQWLARLMRRTRRPSTASSASAAPIPS